MVSYFDVKLFPDMCRSKVNGQIYLFSENFDVIYEYVKMFVFLLLKICFWCFCSSRHKYVSTHLEIRNRTFY